MREPDRYLYRAPFVVPVAFPLIADGGVLTERGRVAAVGRFCDLAQDGAEVVDYEGHVLVPGLVNCHTHLELSCLARLGREEGPAPDDITGWIGRLLEQRAAEAGGPALQDEALFALARLYAGGCRAVIDIGNLPESRAIGNDFKVDVFFFLELLGLAGDAEQAALKRLDSLEDDLYCTAHAPYSTGPVLLQALKKRARARQVLFPLHVAESADEVEFLQHGRGRFRDFLRERGVLEGFTVPGRGAVRYLDSLGVLDARTLCVHGVHVKKGEMALLAERGTHVCLCPGSNRCLGVGKAPVSDYLVHGILPALGTDSLASNPAFSLWEEMRVLRQDHPGLAPEIVFSMATLAGARALGMDHELGIIAPGVSSSLLAVECGVKNEEEVLDFLTSAGEAIRLEWIE